MVKSDNKYEYLPKKYQKKHSLLLYYNDIIANILKMADEKNLSSVKLELRTGDVIPENCDDIIQWMFDNGYNEEAVQCLNAHLLFSLGKDLIMYLHESFSCAERGKVTVAYATSRKPIQDTFIYLCWLLVNPEEIANSLLNQEPSKYDLRNKEERKKTLLEEAGKEVDLIIPGNVMHEVIYVKGAQNGLSSAWDQSLHLVTNNRNYPTEKGNLNFVFADNEIWNDYWCMYYEKMPVIINFVVEVFVKCFERVIDASEEIVCFNRFLRDMKMMNSSESMIEKNVLKEIMENVDISCEYCKKNLGSDTTIISEFHKDFLYTCPHCFNHGYVGDYFS